MKLLQQFCGLKFEEIRDEFLACLQHPEHRSNATVCVCIGRIPE
jgi:hypothetical protein